MDDLFSHTGTASAVAHHAARLGINTRSPPSPKGPPSPSTPRGRSLARIKNLHRAGVLSDKDMSIAKDAIVEGNNIDAQLADLEACGAGERFKIDSIVVTLPRPSEIVRTNSFRALKKRGGGAGGGGGASFDPFAAAASPAKAAGAKAGGDPFGSPASAGSFSDLLGGARNRARTDPFGMTPPQPPPAKATPGSGGASPTRGRSTTDPFQLPATSGGGAAPAPMAGGAGGAAGAAGGAGGGADWWDALGGGGGSTSTPPKPAMVLGAADTPPASRASTRRIASKSRMANVTSADDIFGFGTAAGDAAGAGAGAAAGAAAGDATVDATVEDDYEDEDEDEEEEEDGDDARPPPPAGPPPSKEDEETRLKREASARAAARRRMQRRIKQETTTYPELAGPLWTRYSKLIVKKWNRRFAVLRNATLIVYEDLASAEADLEPVEVLKLQENYMLTDMKVTVNKPRIYYREIAALKPGVALHDSGDSGKHRVLKFGCDTLAEFEKWAKALKSTLEVVRDKARRAEAEALAVDAVMHPGDVMVSAAASPTKPSLRRAGSKSVLAGASAASTTVSVFLVNGDKHTVHVDAGGTVTDVCVGMRDKFGLQADADFSLFVKEHGNFLCLPDHMPAEDAQALGSSDTKELVYKRRLCLRHAGSVDAEAAKAISPDQGAHFFLYIDAVFNVTSSYYIISNAEAVRLAALQLLADNGSFDKESETAAEVKARLSRELDKYVSLQALSTMRGGRSAAVDAIVRAYIALGERTKLSVQQDYIAAVCELPEYGASFFRCEVSRDESAAPGDPGTEATPIWLQVLVKSEWFPVLAGFNSHGLFFRPRPPIHGDSALDPDDIEAEPAWWLNAVRAIEVWGVKKSRPIFTYRVREQKIVTYEMRTEQYQEMASVLHMYVFQLLALREGRKVETHRRSSVERDASGEAAAAAAAPAAEEEGPLPKEWSEIRDPITGKKCWWNSVTRVTVWTRPDPEVSAEAEARGRARSSSGARGRR